MEFNTLIHLLVKALACGAVRRVESGIVTVGAPSPADLAVTVRAGEAGIQHYLLQTLAIFPLEITYKGIISFPIGKGIFIKLLRHIRHINMNSTKTSLQQACEPFCGLGSQDTPEI